MPRRGLSLLRYEDCANPCVASCRAGKKRKKQDQMRVNFHQCSIPFEKRTGFQNWIYNYPHRAEFTRSRSGIIPKIIILVVMLECTWSDRAFTPLRRFTLCFTTWTVKLSLNFHRYIGMFVRGGELFFQYSSTRTKQKNSNGHRHQGTNLFGGRNFFLIVKIDKGLW